MIIQTEGQSQGWFLICGFCRQHKHRDATVCSYCGARVKVIWETESESISPELVMVMRNV